MLFPERERRSTALSWSNSAETRMTSTDDSPVSVRNTLLLFERALPATGMVPVTLHVPHELQATLDPVRTRCGNSRAPIPRNPCKEDHVNRHLRGEYESHPSCIAMFLTIGLTLLLLIVMWPPQPMTNVWLDRRSFPQAQACREPLASSFNASSSLMGFQKLQRHFFISDLSNFPAAAHSEAPGLTHFGADGHSITRVRHNLVSGRGLWPLRQRGSERPFLQIRRTLSLPVAFTQSLEAPQSTLSVAGQSVPGRSCSSSSGQRRLQGRSIAA